MNAYDFDKTIYSGDSTRDFYRFCIGRHPLLMRYLPQQCLAFFLYALGIIDKTKLKQRFYSFFQGIDDIEAEARLFWEAHRDGIYDWYLKQKREDDLVVSASPEFLLRPICAQLGIRNLIASRVDPKTGAYDGLNCYGAEKPARVLARYGEVKIETFYSDSRSDEPLARLAERSFLVVGGVLVPWDE